MLFHDVSCMPISRNTPSNISRITSGGALNDRISDNDSALILPTADLASAKIGSTSANSTSIWTFLRGWKPHYVYSAAAYFFVAPKNDRSSAYLAANVSFSFSMPPFSVSISLFWTLAFCIVFVMSSRAAFALLCFSANFVSCSAASFFSSATTDFASRNLDKPACGKKKRMSIVVGCVLNSIFTKIPWASFHRQPSTILFHVWGLETSSLVGQNGVA